MGIDYSSNFGIGYEIWASDELEDSEELEDGLEEYAYGLCGEGFDCFTTNEGYDGDITGTYLVIREPFKDGLDLTEEKERLDKEIARLKLEPNGDFGLVGGMKIF